MTRQLCLAVSGACLLPLATSCGDSEANDTQWYHARLIASEGSAIPFFLGVPRDCEERRATIVNGAERLQAPCHRSDTGLLVRFPVYGTQIEARFHRDGLVSGHWCREQPIGRTQLMELEARPISAPEAMNRFGERARSTESPRAVVDVSGTWHIEFDAYGFAKGVFAQQPSGVVSGSVEVTSKYGDLRFLSGEVQAGRLLLSAFDGQQAFLLEGDLPGTGTMEGVFTSSDSSDTFTARRVEQLEIPDPLDRVKLTPGTGRLELEPLRAPRYAGKAVIVDGFGTGCPNCHDQTGVLAELYRHHRPDGLEVLGLAFEQSDDLGYKERRVRSFKERHGIDWEIVIAESTLEGAAREELAGLPPIEGVPVTIFVNRDGSVHAIYTGFSGPATGAAYLEAKEQFQRLTNEILRSEEASS